MHYWILIADAAHAFIFSTTGHHDSFHLEREILNPAGRARAQEILTDDLGRYSKGGKHGIRSAMEPGTPVHQVEEQRFAHQLAELLHTALHRGDYNALAIFAPAQFLGLLRQELHPDVHKRLYSSMAKDFTTLNPRDIPRHLSPLLNFPPEGVMT
jgi:protein required for attachment to host cells